MPCVARRALAEFIGTALLLLAVVGSVIAAKRLSPGDTGLELLENAVATGAALAAILWCLGPASGSHLNPAVSLVDSALGGLRARHLPAYLGAQLLGGVTGVVVAKLMFSLPAVTISAHVRSGDGLWLARRSPPLGSSSSSLAWCGATGRPRSASRWAPTSPARTSSPRRPASPIPRWRWRACSPTPSRESAPVRWRRSSRPSWPVRRSAFSRSGCFIPQSPLLHPSSFSRAGTRRTRAQDEKGAG